MAASPTGGDSTQVIAAVDYAGPGSLTQRIDRVAEAAPASAAMTVAPPPATLPTQAGPEDTVPPRSRPTSEPASIVNPRLAELVERSRAGAQPAAPYPDGGAPDAEAVPVQASRFNATGFWAATVVFWLVALLAGVACAVAAGGRRVSPCSKNASSLGCTTTGSALSVVMLLVVIAVVGTVTVYAFDLRRRTRGWARVLGGGLAILVVLGVAAWLIIRSIR